MCNQQSLSQNNIFPYACFLHFHPLFRCLCTERLCSLFLIMKRAFTYVQWNKTLLLFIFYCVLGGTSHSFSQPHQRSFCKEPGQHALNAPLRSGAIKGRFSLTQNHFPLSLPSERLTQVPPPPQLQWHLPLQFHVYKHENFLQNQER